MSTTLPAKEMPINESAQSFGRVMTKPPPMKAARSGPLADRIFGWLAKSAALFTLAMLVAILASLTISAWPAREWVAIQRKHMRVVGCVPVPNAKPGSSRMTHFASDGGSCQLGTTQNVSVMGTGSN
mgnify:CR=1 FL=1